jgi:hypothetical protein
MPTVSIEAAIEQLLAVLAEGFEGPQQKWSYFTDQGAESGLFGTLVALNAATVLARLGWDHHRSPRSPRRLRSRGLGRMDRGRSQLLRLARELERHHGNRRRMEEPSTAAARRLRRAAQVDRLARVRERGIHRRGACSRRPRRISSWCHPAKSRP